MAYDLRKRKKRSKRKFKSRVGKKRLTVKEYGTRIVKRKIASKKDVKRIINDTYASRCEIYKATLESLQNDGFVHHFGNSIIAGFKLGERLSYSVRITHFSIRINFFNPNTNGLNNAIVRLLVLENRRPNVTDFKSKLFKADGTTNLPISYVPGTGSKQLYYPINDDQWKVISDRRIRLNSDILGHKGTQYKALDYKVKYDKKMTFTTNIDPLLRVLPQVKFILLAQPSDPSVSSGFTVPLKYQCEACMHFIDSN